MGPQRIFPLDATRRFVFLETSPPRSPGAHSRETSPGLANRSPPQHFPGSPDGGDDRDRSRSVSSLPAAGARTAGERASRRAARGAPHGLSFGPRDSEIRGGLYGPLAQARLRSYSSARDTEMRSSEARKQSLQGRWGHALGASGAPGGSVRCCRRAGATSGEACAPHRARSGNPSASSPTLPRLTRRVGPIRHIRSTSAAPRHPLGVRGPGGSAPLASPWGCGEWRFEPAPAARRACAALACVPLALERAGRPWCGDSAAATGTPLPPGWG